MYLRNTAGQFITFCMISATDGSPVTGITPTCRRCIDGTFAAGGGTVTEDTGLGFYKYAMAQADTNGVNIGLRFTGTGAIDKEVNFITTAGNLDEVTTARMGTLTDWINGGRLDLILDIIAADTTTDIPALIAALNNISAAQVNAEVLDVLNVDTFAQPGQGTPAATTTMRLMIAYLYKAWRNKTEQTSSQYSLYNDDAATVDHKAAVSDDSTTFTKGEVATGP